jgi:hypothetical protein
MVDFIDIVKDSLPNNKYKESEDPRKIILTKSNPIRGPLSEQWLNQYKDKNMPIMCSYKIVKTNFEVWGLQTRVESWTQKVFYIYFVT